MRILGGAIVTTVMLLAGGPALAQDFPFGAEMTLDARPLPGSKRVPSLEIDDSGAVRLELWCKGGTGQFSVAGATVIFVPGAMEERSCAPERAQLDEALLAALGEATGWKRDSQTVTFVGPKPLRFRLLSN